jgi:hypothetical protein
MLEQCRYRNWADGDYLSDSHRPARMAIAATALVVVSASLLGFSSFDGPGPPLDEGALVAYPTFVQHGEVPWRDYENFYGPGEPYLVAGAFELFGPNVETERAVGLVIRIAIVLSLFLLVLPWGFAAAVVAGAISLLALGLPVNANPLADAIALGLASLALLSRAHLRRGEGRSPLAAELAAGVTGGLALAFRPDLAPAVLLGAVPFAVAADRDSRLRIAGGFSIGILPTLVWLAVVGFDQIGHVAGDLIASQPGRRLPLPGPASLEGQALIASCLAILATFFAAVQARARDRWGLEAVTLFGLGLFAALLIPATIQRADAKHLEFLAAVALASLPAAVVEGLRGQARGSRGLLTIAGISALVAAVAVVHTFGSTLKRVVLKDQYADYAVTLGERSFPISGREAATDLNAVLPALDRMASPGDSLFVGTNDLTRSNYNDTFVYYLFPELRHASPFTEFNPQTANAEDSGLATQLEEADFILRTSRWDDWDEPNASDERGPTAPDQVVDRDFELVAAHGTYELLRRKQEGVGGPGPASTRAGG